MISLAVAPVRPASRKRKIKAVEIRSKRGSSFEIVFLLILMGLIRAATPIKRRMFRILLPITLPRSISVLPLISEEIETASSGAPVPKATIVRPISCFETLKFEAAEEAPDTSQFAPLIKRVKPTIRRRICRIFSMFIL